MWKWLRDSRWPGTYVHFYKYVLIRKGNKIFWPVVCVIVFPDVSCSVSMKRLQTQQNTNVWFASVGFSCGNQKEELSKFFSVQMHIEIILENSGSLRPMVWLALLQPRAIWAADLYAAWML